MRISHVGEFPIQFNYCESDIHHIIKLETKRDRPDARFVGIEAPNFEEMTELYKATLEGDSAKMKQLVGRIPTESLLKPITATGDTIFHIAANIGKRDLLEILFGSLPPSRIHGASMMKNVQGNTLLHEVAASGEVDVAVFLLSLITEQDVQKRAQMLEDRNKLGETPLYRAAAYADDNKNKAMVVRLVEQIQQAGNDVRNHFRRNDEISILHVAVTKEHFDTAIWLLKKEPNLATYKEKNSKTCLHLLASMPTAFRSTSPMSIPKEFLYKHFDLRVMWEGLESHQPPSKQSMDLVSRGAIDHSKETPGTKISRYLWNMKVKYAYQLAMEKQKHTWANELAKMLIEKANTYICFETGQESSKTGGSTAPPRSPETPLIIAARTGIVEIVDKILDVYPQALEYVTESGENILHVIILHRRKDIFDRIKDKPITKRKLALRVDNEGCTILHKAAATTYYSGGKAATPALKLQEELMWFDEVKALIPSGYTIHTIHRNRKNLTAEEVFKKQHEEQLKDAQEWVKTTCQSCSTVAVLIANVVFAAAFTAPGGFDKHGRPVHLQQPLYSVFTVMNVAGLASSLASVLIFLSVLTSSLDQKDFDQIIPRRFSFGFAFLFFSVATTMLSFTAAKILILHIRSGLVKSITFAAAFFPIAVYAAGQFSLYFAFFSHAIKRNRE